ncbi:kinase-like domain-containing protein [Cytidiella melzeri]|nr:kinase-like domain-containing protein [Cytidiella melzeri]
MTVTPATIVRHISIAKRARANVIQSHTKSNDRQSAFADIAPSAGGDDTYDKRSARSGRSNSPASLDSNCSDASSTGVSITSSSEPVSSPGSRPTTLTTGEAQKWKGSDIKLSANPYVETSPQPSPLAGEFNHNSIITQATVRGFRESEEAIGLMQRPSILIDDIPVTDGTNEESPLSATSMAPSPVTPALRYSGWVTALVAPIKEFIDETVDPRDLYADLHEVAEGESGSVFAARVVRSARAGSYVAIKQVALLPSGSQKLVELERELRVMKGVRHKHLLSMEVLYVDLVEDSLWISMELMDRSLADILNLIEEGVEVQEQHIAHFTKDALTALSFLQTQRIAHRDVRSDNLLVNQRGVLKLADFSNAVRVSAAQPSCDEPAGVIFWQAPEMRRYVGRYNPLKVDVWSLGATVWEMAQAQPPFADATDASQIGDTLPPLDSPESFSRSFHDFLQLCSQPCSSRPEPETLLDTPFIRTATDRRVAVDLLLRCRSTEEELAKRLSVASQGTVCL